MKKVLFLIFIAFFSLKADILDEADKAFSEQAYEEALEKYTQACKDNDAKACFKAGFIYFNARGVKKDDNMSLKFYEKSCKLKDADGCFKVGLHYEKAKKKDLEKMKEYYTYACDLNKTRACEKVADLYKYTFNGSREQIIEFYKKACIGGSSSSCYQLAFMYEENGFVNKDEAAKWLKISCDREDIESCHRLVDIYIKDIANTDVDEEVVREYEKKCNLNDGTYCYKLAVIHMIGKGVKRDYKKAKEILLRSCELGSKACCMEYIMLEDRGY